MIYYDKNTRQILSSHCSLCPDLYFRPEEKELPHVGCCSYSPVFTLFEIYKMLKENKKTFFLANIYQNQLNTIRPFEIEIHAQVHPHFNKIMALSLTPMEIDDKKIKYSVCQFFIIDKGCGLPSSFKTSVCRTFICSTLEEQLRSEDKLQMSIWIKEIQKETIEFNQKHQKMLKEKGWNLKEHITPILSYLEQIG